MIVLQLIVWLAFGVVALISFAYFMRMCELTEKGENKDFPRKLVATIELTILILLCCGVYTLGKWLDDVFF